MNMTQFCINQKLKEHNIKAKKALGQNFIFDENILRKIVGFAGDLTKGQVLEIGAGPGGLTQAILEAGAKNVVAIEKDPRFLPILTELSLTFPGRLSVLIQDALKIDLREINDWPLRIIANLPYQISTVLLVKLLTEEICSTNCTSLTLMFQKEVAERIVAKIGTKRYGRLSLMVNLKNNVTKILDVKPSSFIPRPKVDSTVIKIIPNSKFAHVDDEIFEKIVKICFSQRRKKIKNNLDQLDINTAQLLELSNISPDIRAENIDIEGFCRISNNYKNLVKVNHEDF